MIESHVYTREVARTQRVLAFQYTESGVVPAGLQALYADVTPISMKYVPEVGPPLKTQVLRVTTGYPSWMPHIAQIGDWILVDSDDLHGPHRSTWKMTDEEFRKEYQPV